MADKEFQQAVRDAANVISTLTSVDFIPIIRDNSIYHLLGDFFNQLVARVNFEIKSKINNYTILDSENRTHFNNLFATGEVDFTLPLAAEGLSYSFTVLEAQVLKIICVGGDLIKNDVFSAGNLSCSTIYSILTIESPKTGIWVVMYSTGAWG